MSPPVPSPRAALEDSHWGSSLRTTGSTLHKAKAPAPCTPRS